MAVWVVESVRQTTEMETQQAEVDQSVEGVEFELARQRGVVEQG